MTPQERELVAELFTRLAALENAPRDPDAERAIAEGLGRAPHAVYALVQTVLVQDEALKRANARIAELEGQGGEPPRQGGFLDNMRDALLGRDERRGSVPSVRPGGLGSSGVWGAGTAPAAPSGYGQPAMGSPIGMGGSFLGTAAASAAGVIGGAMLLGGIRSMFGHSQAYGTNAFDPGLAAATSDSPWGSNAAGSDLARQAGIDNIDRFGSPGQADTSTRASFFGGNDDKDDGGYADSNDDSDSTADFDGGDSDNP
jgi:uncharacterized protein